MKLSILTPLVLLASAASASQITHEDRQVAMLQRRMKELRQKMENATPEQVAVINETMKQVVPLLNAHVANKKAAETKPVRPEPRQLKLKERRKNNLRKRN